jgi:ribosomal protein S18 acetylase RimI-like enzyme
MIRTARADDIAAAAGLMAEAYATHFRPMIGDAALGFDQAHFEARFTRDLADLTVLDEGALTGVLLLTDGHIAMLFVVAPGGGRGAAVLAHAEAQGARSLEVFAANDGARRFYERAGWQVASEYDREFAGATHRFLRYEKPAPEQTGRGEPRSVRYRL